MVIGVRCKGPEMLQIDSQQLVSPYAYGLHMHILRPFGECMLKQM